MNESMLKNRLFSKSLCVIAALSLCACSADIPPSGPTGHNGVVSSANPDASAIGISVLEAGGSAVDAAVAVSFALGLLEPHASGLGGCGYALYAPSDGEAIFYDYRSMAPMATDAAAFMQLSDEERKNSILGAGVPGAVAGWLSLYEDYGTLPLADLLQPTIDLSENGFTITDTLAGNMSEQFLKLSADEACGSLFLHDGLPYSSGDLLQNPGYAKTLRLIAQQGRDGFYTGEVAEAVLKASAQKSGWFAEEDFSGYEVLRTTPIVSTYRGYTILSSAPSSSGGVGIAECLNVLERYDLSSMGQSTPESLHLIAEALKLAHSDRYQYVGDPKFVPVPVNTLISKEYAAQRAAQINENSATDIALPGRIPKESPSTTHFSIVDKWGNMISVTNTLGTFFGCGTGVDGYGFILDNQMYDFSVDSWEANFAQPGKRPRSSMSPTVIYAPDGTPFAALGTPGGEAIVSTMVQLIINLIDYRMPLQQAIDAPRIHQNYEGHMYVEGGFAPETLAELEALGHVLTKRNANDSFFGGVHAALRNDDGSWTGGADPRRDGKALAIR
ncbi:MAG: gamma-glutamyltransferase [Christensenellaceae bacterium]|jgi:gamma-glutamyltranspeptidase/glutathione hydrolase|nr:gamma-glutamyltransferase [Christensenellaceae bacterium]